MDHQYDFIDIELIPSVYWEIEINILVGSLALKYNNLWFDML